MHILHGLTTTLGALLAALVHGQFLAIPSEDLRAIPFDRLTLVVTRAGTPQLDSMLNAVLQEEWTLTPRYELRAAEQIGYSHSDSSLLLLDLYHVYVHIYPGGSSSGSASAPVSELRIERERLMFATENAGVVQAPGGNGSFYYKEEHTGPLNEGYAGLTRGGHERSFAGQPTLAKQGAIAYAPIDLWGRERLGVVDQYRLRMILRGIQRAVALGRTSPFKGSTQKVTTDMEMLYNKRFRSISGKTLILPGGWLAKSEEAWFTSRFNDRLRILPSGDVERMIQAKDSTRVLLLPLGQRIMLYDMATLEVVYVMNVKTSMTEAKVKELDRRWRVNER